MASFPALLIGLVAAAGLAGAARAEQLGGCMWAKLSPAEHARVLAAYGQNMAGGAAALDKLSGKLKAAAAACAGRRDIPADWIPTIAGSEAVQTFAAGVLHLDRARLDATWAAAPANIAACVRANGRLAFYPNGTGCTDPAAPAWLLKQLGIDRSRQPAAAQQATWYFNAKAIGEWGDQLVAKLPPRGR